MYKKVKSIKIIIEFVKADPRISVIGKKEIKINNKTLVLKLFFKFK